MSVVQDVEAAPSQSSDTDLVNEFWSVEGRDSSGLQWSELPQVEPYLFARASGDPNVDWLEHSRRFMEHLPSPRRAISLGCGFGIIERIVRQRDICQIIDGVDLADGAVEGARRLAAEEGLDGLTYWAADLHTIELPENTYDVVYAHASLHHVFYLERLLEQVRKTLKPGGLFLIYDYVGPSQMQFPKAHLELADAMLRLIPEQYRRNLRVGGYKTEAHRLTLDMMNSADPSEGIRAHEIIPLVASRFDIQYFRHMGGSLLLLVFNDIAGNFRRDDPVASQIVEMMLRLEATLIDSGVLPSYHAYMVAKKTDNALPMQSIDYLPPLGLQTVIGSGPPQSVAAAPPPEPALVELGRLLANLQQEREATSGELTALRATLAERERQVADLRGEHAQSLVALGQADQKAAEFERRLGEGHKLCRLSWRLRKALLRGF